jgi:hypothetical protein
MIKFAVDRPVSKQNSAKVYNAVYCFILVLLCSVVCLSNHLLTLVGGKMAHIIAASEGCITAFFPPF